MTEQELLSLVEDYVKQQKQHQEDVTRALNFLVNIAALIADQNMAIMTATSHGIGDLGVLVQYQQKLNEIVQAFQDQPKADEENQAEAE